MTDRNREQEAWIDTGDICPECGFRGSHIRRSDGIYCGRCRYRFGFKNKNETSRGER